LITSDQCHTPPDLFNLIDKRYGPFTIDVAADCENRLCIRYCGQCVCEDGLCNIDRLSGDGLLHDWSQEVAFCNPPYSRGAVLPWVDKAPTAKRIAMLVKADFTPDWARKIWQTADEIAMLQSRVPFGGPGAMYVDKKTGKLKKAGADFPSMLALWGVGGRVHSDSGTAPHVWAWDWRSALSTEVHT
jgi:phage N-6-adenine-methyltransferase